MFECLNHPFTYEENTYVLQPSFTDLDGSKIQAIKHTPDYQIQIGETTHIVEIKGYETNEFKIKLKMFKYNVLRHNSNFVYHLVKTKGQLLHLIIKFRNELQRLRQVSRANPIDTKKDLES